MIANNPHKTHDLLGKHSVKKKFIKNVFTQMVKQKIVTQYQQKLLPLIIDKTCGIASIASQRQLVVPKAYGDVLEVGVGTGLNALFYNSQQVNKVIGIDPHLHPIAKKRFAQVGIALEETPLCASKIPLADNSVDSVVMTYTLCSIAKPLDALHEIQRVLKPTGKLFYSEHGLAPNPTGKWQHRLNPLWQPFSGGCQLNCNIEALLRQAGFKVTGEQGYILQSQILGYHYWGEASY